MNKFHLNSIAAALALGTFLAGAAAQTTGTATTATPAAPAVQPGTGTRNAPSSKTTRLDRADRKFIEHVAGDGMFEVEVAKLAATKATSPEVKSFASMMVDDHTKANSELAQIANAKGVELPAGPPHAKRRQLEKMAKLTGDKFDREFAREVGIEDHKKDIKLFEKTSKKAKDPDVKAFVDKTLPTLRAHLAAASKLPQNSKVKS